MTQNKQQKNRNKQEHPEHIYTQKNKITHECQTTKNENKNKKKKSQNPK